MRRLAVALFVLSAPALPQRIVYSPGPCRDFTCQPVLDEGHLIHLYRSGQVEVFNREGIRLLRATLLNPAGRSVAGVSSAAIDSDETLAVTASWDVPHGYAGGILLFDRQGRHIRTIEVGRFVPKHVTFDPHHYIWVYGWQRDPDDWGAEDPSDYTLVRKFSKDGQEEGRLLHRLRFPGWTGGVDLFRAANDRLGMLVTPAGKGGSHWIEIDFTGKYLGNWNLGEPGWIAYTAEARLYTTTRDTNTNHLLLFDRDSAEWRPVMELNDDQENGFTYGALEGCDGEQLVLSDSRNTRLIWLTVK